MKLNELLDPALLAQRIEEKYVVAREHPTKPYRIYNYTDSAMWDRVWDDVTRVCRGLIVDTRTDEVVARPFAKFFNSEEPQAAQIAADEPVIVTDKADGSLGILFWADDQWEVATRGSFTSEQAQHATKVWQAKYGDVRPQSGMTFLFEIVYPENRYVIDYRGMDDLVLLGAIDIGSGQSADPERTRAALGWSGPVVQEFTYATLTEALAAPPRDNAEGLVVWAPESNARVKIKYAEYKRLFRLLTGLTPRRLWEYLAVKAVAPTIPTPEIDQTPLDVQAAQWAHWVLAGPVVQGAYVFIKKRSRLVDMFTWPVPRKAWRDLEVKAGVIGKKKADPETPVEYLTRRLHMSPQRVEEVLGAPDDWTVALVDRVPEEFEQWVRERVDQIRADVDWTRAAAVAAYEELRGDFAEAPTSGKARGEFVKQARAYSKLSSFVLHQLDGSPIEAMVWDHCRPGAERAFAQQSEDVA